MMFELGYIKCSDDEEYIVYSCMPHHQFFLSLALPRSARIRVLTWTDRGELVQDAAYAPRRNIVDLVHDALRKRR